MREILFRSKRIDNGEWAEGQTIVVIHQDDNDLIFMPQHGEDVKADPMEGNDRALTSIYGNYYQILPQTVGQYTGLTDKNGKKIFIDDIVEAKRPPHFQRGVVTQLSDGLYVFEGKKYHDLIDFKLEDVNLERCLSVIGNIHDNPELLEVEE